MAGDLVLVWRGEGCLLFWGIVTIAAIEAIGGIATIEIIVAIAIIVAIEGDRGYRDRGICFLYGI